MSIRTGVKVLFVFNLAHTHVNQVPYANTRIILARAQEKPGNRPKIKCMNSACPLHYVFLLGILDCFFPLGKGLEVEA